MSNAPIPYPPYSHVILGQSPSGETVVMMGYDLDLAHLDEDQAEQLARNLRRKQIEPGTLHVEILAKRIEVYEQWRAHILARYAEQGDDDIPDEQGLVLVNPCPHATMNVVHVERFHTFRITCAECGKKVEYPVINWIDRSAAERYHLVRISFGQATADQLQANGSFDL